MAVMWLDREGWTSASWHHAIGQTGSGQVEGDPTVVEFDGQVSCIADGDVVWSWTVEDRDRVDGDHPQTVWSGRGRAADLERSVVLPEGYPSQTSRERSFTGWAPMRIWRTLADEAKSRGRLSWLSWSFTDSQDSNGEPWTTTFDVELEPGVDLLELLRQMAEAEGAEWYVGPDGVLHVAPQIGQDRTSEVTLTVGTGLLSFGRRESWRDVRRRVFLEAATGVEEATSSANPDAGEIWLEAQDFAGSLAAASSRVASVVGDPQVEVSVPVSADCGIYDRFQVGDLVGVDDGEQVSPARVVGVAVSVADQVDIELTLVSQVELRRAKVERALRRKADVNLAASVSLQRRHGLVRADRIETGSLQADAEIRSTDYVPGQQGWRISGDGDVEFDRGTFRGELTADQITSGTLPAVRIPDLDADKITSGQFDAVRIPELNADKITSGTFDAVRIPSLDADKITSGTFDAVRIPNLSADKITAGTMSGDRIDGGEITGVTITGGSLNTTNSDVKISGNKIELVSRANNSGVIEFSQGGEIRSSAAGFLRIDAPQTRIGALSSGISVTQTGLTLDPDDGVLLGSDVFIFNSERNPADDRRRLVLDRSRPRILAYTNTGAAAVFGINENGNVVNFRRSGASVGNISVTTTNTSYNNTSDERLKTDIEDLSGSLDRILQLRPVMHGWVQDPDAPRRPSLIAQQANNVTPWAVTEGEVWQMDYSKLVPDLVSAVQELACQVQELTSGC